MFETEARSKGCPIVVKIQTNGSELTLQPRDLRQQAVRLGLPKIEMDRRQIELAFKNLLHNAIKYSFRSIPNRPPRFIEVRVRFHGRDTCEVSFTNYGVGIMVDEIQRGLIWKPWYRGRLSMDRNRTGVGLGLAIVKRMIEETHSGRVDVESVPQLRGAYRTTFRVTLPISRLGHGTKETRT